MLDTLYWDLPRLFEEIKMALRKAAAVGPASSTASASIPGASISA